MKIEIIQATYFTKNINIYLLSIYAKNKQEDLSIDDKKILKELANYFKGDSNG